MLAVLLLLGRLAVLLEPVRPLVPAVGRLAVGPEAVVGRVPLLSVRTELLPEATRPVEALPEMVGRVPLIEPVVVRFETVAPFCGAKPLLPAEWLIDPVVPVLP